MKQQYLGHTDRGNVKNKRNEEERGTSFRNILDENSKCVLCLKLAQIWGNYILCNDCVIHGYESLSNDKICKKEMSCCQQKSRYPYRSWLDPGKRNYRVGRDGHVYLYDTCVSCYKRDIIDYYRRSSESMNNPGVESNRQLHGKNRSNYHRTSRSTNRDISRDRTGDRDRTGENTIKVEYGAMNKYNHMKAIDFINSLEQSPITSSNRLRPKVYLEKTEKVSHKRKRDEKDDSDRDESTERKKTKLTHTKSDHISDRTSVMISNSGDGSNDVLNTGFNIENNTRSRDHNITLNKLLDDKNETMTTIQEFPFKFTNLLDSFKDNVCKMIEYDSHLKSTLEKMTEDNNIHDQNIIN